MSTTVTLDRSFDVATITERFYVRMAIAFLAVAFIGFAPTYWVPMVRGTLAIRPIAHVHALFFYGWLLLFLKQSSLAASGRLVRHREMGVLGVAVATGMCFVGLAMAVDSIRTMDAAGFGDAGRRFAIVPVTAIALFAGMFAVALLNVSRPEVHKRVLLAATASLLQAAVGRWFVLALAPPRPRGDDRTFEPSAGGGQHRARSGRRSPDCRRDGARSPDHGTRASGLLDRAGGHPVGTGAACAGECNERVDARPAVAAGPGPLRHCTCRESTPGRYRGTA